ncbi:MAG: molecular chaperone DnaJ, partial [Gammaproteobacteria bacterium]|nr:molecular chaperone DnaJ [Gammaproteobacteria bacterium]
VKSVRGSMIGDLICRVTVETPVKLNREQKDLLQQFKDTLEGASKRHSPQTHSWLDGVKKFFDDMKPKA